MKITNDIKEQDTSLRAKTAELDDTIQGMKMTVASYPRSKSPNSKTNSHLISEMGSLRDEMTRSQGKVNEKLSGELKEIKNEVFNKLDEEVGRKIQTEVMEQCDIKALAQEWQKSKLQYAGGTSEDILNHVLKQSGDAHSQVTTLESKLSRLEAKSQIIDNVQIQVSNLEEKVQKLTTKCSEEIRNQLKGQTGTWNEMINQGIQRKFQQSMDAVVKHTSTEVQKINEGK